LLRENHPIRVVDENYILFLAVKPKFSVLPYCLALEDSINTSIQEIPPKGRDLQMSKLRIDCVSGKAEGECKEKDLRLSFHLALTSNGDLIQVWAIAKRGLVEKNQTLGDIIW
jgi:hypothetical protein